MALPFHNLLTSKPFVFLVGPEKQEFHVSRDAVAGLSPALRTLVENGAFLEANEGKATWDDIDTPAFARFCQFAYVGDYEGPLKTGSADIGDHGQAAGGERQADSAVSGDEKAESFGVDLAVEEKMIWENLSPDLRNSDKSGEERREEDDSMEVKTIGELKSAIASHTCYYVARVVYGGRCIPSKPFEGVVDEITVRCKCNKSECGPTVALRNSKDGEQDLSAIESAVLYGDPFPEHDTIATQPGKYSVNKNAAADPVESLLAHAKVYILGDKWDVVGLKALSLEKLQQALRDMSRDMRFDESVMKRVLELARYTYENTASDNDNLRGLVAHYIAAKVGSNEFGARKGFLDLIDEVPGFGRDVWKIAYELRMQW